MRIWLAARFHTVSENSDRKKTIFARPEIEIDCLGLLIL